MIHNIKSETKHLQCTLTEEELKKYSQTLARTTQEKGEVESRKKEAMSAFNADIASKEATMASLASKINSGWEFRDVECEWIYDWDTGTKTLYRKDTDECLARSIPIEPDERQLNLV